VIMYFFLYLLKLVFANLFVSVVVWIGLCEGSEI
jgi:hypothetical protein